MNDSSIRRSALLSALCLLSFAGSGASFIIYFLGSVFFEEFAALIMKYSSTHTMENLSPMYFTLFMVLNAVSLTGAIRMWKMHFDGFFIYTIAQIVLFVIPLVWLGSDAFSAPAAIFTGVFITGYALNWKSLKR